VDHYGLQNMAPRQQNNTVMMSKNAKNSAISTARCVSNQLTQRVSLNGSGTIGMTAPQNNSKIDFYSPEAKKVNLKRQEYASS